MYLIQPIILIRLLWKSRYIPDYRHKLFERYGFFEKKVQSGGIVLHAVSVGEMFIATLLINSLQHKYPQLPITITTMTPSGLKQAKLAFGNYINYIYLPYDLRSSMKRFLNHINPILFIAIETELWPNLIRLLYHRAIPFIVVNARLSLFSMYGYKKVNFFIKSIIKRITLVLAQNKEDALRFLEIGLQKDKLRIIGNIKFDIHITTELSERISYLKKKWRCIRPIWIAASTHHGEEKIIIQAHKRLLCIFPNLLMILAPRHIERVNVVENMVSDFGLHYILYSSGKIPTNNIQIVINDTIGELMLLYGISDIAFIGGSLIRHGGHNPLEAAAHALPIIMGPYTFNFNNICVKLNELGSLITITNVSTLVQTLMNLFNNKAYRVNCGKCALKFLYQNRGALQKVLSILEPYITRNKIQNIEK